jgi:hypothetical protein
LVQAATVGEPTRWGWEAALKAITYFLRPEGFLPRGVRIQSMPRGAAPQREPIGLYLSVFDFLIQPSLSMGHPVGATGLAQVAEAVLQLRGEAGK